MYIKQVIIEGYKSYREQVATEDFSPKVNCVVGANGSGKSNFFHAIRFVISDLFHNLRSEERQALLHEGAGHQVLSAFVEIVFDNSDNRMPVDKEEVRLRRTIGLKKDEYFLDGKHITKTEVQNLLESAGFSRSNPYYVVQQGKIASLTLMKDSERLDLLKEIGGTRVYEERRRESLKIMQETGNKRKQIIQVVQYLDERLNELEQEKEELKKYQQLDKQRKSLEYTIYDKELHDARQKLNEVEEARNKVAENSTKMYESVLEAHEKSKELEKLSKDLTKEIQILSKEKEAVEKQRTEAIRKRAQLDLDYKDLQEKMSTNIKAKDDAQKQLMILEREVQETKNSLNDIKPLHEKQVKEEEDITRGIMDREKRLSILYQKQGRATQFASKAARDKWLQKEIDEYERVLSSTLMQEKKLQDEIDQLKNDMRDQDDIIKVRKVEVDKKETFISGYRNAYNQYKVDRDKLHNERKSLWTQETELTTEIERLKAEVVKAEKSLDHATPGDIRRGLNSVRRICREYEISGVFGPIFELLECEDKFFTAVEVTAGNSLFHVVVDNDETSTKIIRHLNAQKGGRVTFIPLNRVKKPYVNYPQGSDVIPLLKKLRFSDSYSRAFEQVFARTVICRNLDVATRVARTDGLDCITLEGDQVSKKGGMTGGFYDHRRSKLRFMSTIKQNTVSINLKERELEEVRYKLQEIDQKINELVAEQQKNDAGLGHDKSELEQLKQDILNAERQKQSILKALQKKEKLLGNILSQIDQLRASIAMKQDEMGTELVDHLTPEERDSLSRLNPEITALKEQLIACRANRIETETRKEELEMNLSTNLERRKQELMAMNSSVDVDMLQAEVESKYQELKDADSLVDHVTKELTRVSRNIDERNKRLKQIKQEKVIVASPDQVLELMDFGESHRHIGETNMNLYSSRSHTIFRMIIESREKAEDSKSENSCDAVRVSVLNLVDLAGSERAAKTGAEGVRLKEGSHINKSLMTLGTVIKKLSEGAENQGGHVPYRDSKLTRILQPALGGNANTAIICNITLAQIHADETKSSLQFASRALRVTNCVHVNEILTDAALLKRQKKEIEDLRAKLQASHSEHPDEEILNLRNTLLKSELERERIALELEEEKKAQAEREKRLQEQAKKIQNLSSMVLCSSTVEGRDTYKKDKRRYTWCPGNLSKEALEELSSAVKEKVSVVQAKGIERDVGPLLPFEELLDADSNLDSGKQEDNSRSNPLEVCTLPDPQALLHVTSRRKVASRKKSSSLEDNDLLELQREYEELLLKYESHKTVSEVKIDYLTRKLFEADINLVDGSEQYDNSLMLLCGSKTLREAEAIFVIKQLQEKITVLEMERSSSQHNLDSVVEIATEQTISAREKHEELYQELLSAKLDAQGAREQLASMETAVVLVEDNMKSETELMREVQDLMSEFENSRTLIDSFIPVVEELVLSFSAISKLVPDLKSSALDNSNQIRSVIINHEKLQFFLRQKINVVQDEKILLDNQSFDLHNQIEELRRAIEDSGNAFTEMSEKYEAEKSEHLSQIQSLQKELSCLSSSSLGREKENIRKDLEKTKAKLRDTESKLRNAIQEKTKLEGERACAEREIKRLNGQRAILERDINKRDSNIGRRRDSVVDRSSNVLDSKRSKNSSVCVEHVVQEEYRKLEVLAFEMETTIASLEEELTISHAENEEANSRAENLACELQALSDELNMSNTELSMLKEEVSCLRLCSEESESRCQRLETSVNILVEEKEDLAMQLTDALLEMEEEKAIWLAREKATVEAINEKAKSYSAEIANVSRKMTEVTNELESCRTQCKLLEESLVISENNASVDKRFSEEKLLEIDQLRLSLRDAEEQCRRFQEEKKDLCKEVERLKMELSMLNKERVDLLARSRESETELIQRDDFQLSNSNHEVEQLSEKLSALEAKMHHGEVNHNSVKAKLRMRLRGAQAKLDAFRVRYQEAMDEIDYMNKKFEAASSKLKNQLASSGLEILSLKKQLASGRGS